MQYYSTNDKALRVSFKDALFSGMPEDKGLYMPKDIPDLSSFFKGNTHLSFQEIGYLIASQFIDKELSINDLHEIIENSITFDAPNKYIYDSIFFCRLRTGLESTIY